MKKLLNIGISDDIDINEVEKLLLKMKKEKEVAKLYDLSKIKERSNGQVYLYVNRKQITGHSREDLIDKLYEMNFGINKATINDLWKDHMIYRRDETKTSSKTLQEYVSVYKNHFAGKDIVNMPIVDIKTSTLTDFFKKYTKEKEITEDRYKSLRSVISSVLNYAIHLNIIQTNAADHIDKKQLTFKSKAEQKRRKIEKIISAEERTRMINHLEDLDSHDIYDLAVLFAFHNTLRVGEVKALKWKDFNYEKGVFFVDKQITEYREMNDDITFGKRIHKETNHIKGNTEKGIRTLPFSESSVDILKKIKEYYPNSDSEYIFATEYGTITTTTFNRHLDKHCETLGISKKSSHDIRFSSASTLYAATKDITDIQQACGHTTLTMAQHYVKQIKSAEEQKNNYLKALG